MLEPLTATLLHTLLSARPPGGNSLPKQPAFRMSVQNTSSWLSRDFFTPAPRSAKGKERAAPDDDCTYAACPEPAGSRRGARHLSALAGTPCRPRMRRMSGRKTLHTLSRNSLPSIHNLVRQADLSQRRHASSLLEARRASSSSPAELDAEQWRHLIAGYSSGAVASDPEEVWRAYESLHDHDGCASMEVPQLLDYGGRVLETIQGMRPDAVSEDSLRLWGMRLRKLLDGLQPRIGNSSLDTDSFFYRCLAVSALALTGDLKSAQLGSDEVNRIPLDPDHRHHVVRMYRIIILSMRQYRSPVAVLDFILDEWDALGPYVAGESYDWETGEGALGPVTSFRRHAYETVSCIESPVAYMLEIEHLSRERRRLAGQFLIDVLSRSRMGNEAYDVLQLMEQQSLPVRLQSQLAVVTALVKVDSFELANTLFASLSRWMTQDVLFMQYQKVGLYLFASQGDVPRAEDWFNRLHQLGRANPRSIALLMHAHAFKGYTARVVSLFHHFFPPGSGHGPSRTRPNIYHYTAVIFSFAKAADYDGLSRWLERMSADGIKPDIYVYGIILKSFAARGDMQAVIDLLNQMRAIGMQPNREVYTTVIALLAKRQDSVAAEGIFERALKEGIVPDRWMVTALMNAYIESGQWHDVVRAFDYMRSSARRRIRLSLEVYNTLLKAYVMIGAPFRVVADLFQALEDSRIRPDAYTFALLIQSACDSDLVQIASELFAEMERLTEDWQSSLHINIYVLTILMSAYLRTGRKGKAKEMFQEMKRRGIQPTAATYSAIVKAYGFDPTGAGLQVAEDLLQTLTLEDPRKQPWMAASNGRSSALAAIFNPLLMAYARRERPDYIKRLIKEMLDVGGERDIGTLTALLDAYRRQGNARACLELWPEIQEIGLRKGQVAPLFADMNDEDRPEIHGQGNLLCVPLSICMDALSAGGYHTELSHIWRTLHEAGVAFDSHNWNHLVVALTRAGEIERAFEVVERVILPIGRRLRASVHMSRGEAPDSPLPDKTADKKLNIASESPLHHQDRRPQQVRTATKQSKVMHEQGKPGDFAHALHILAQMSPLWNLWRPHDAILYVLRDVLEHLHGGRLVQPIVSPYAPPSAVVAPSTWAVRDRIRRASQIMNNLYENCPETVEIVHAFAEVMRARISKVRYRRSQA